MPVCQKIAIELHSIGIEDDDLVDYIEGILADDVLSSQEKKETVMEIVLGVIDSCHQTQDIEVLVGNLIENYILHSTPQSTKTSPPTSIKSSLVVDLVTGKPLNSLEKSDGITAEALEEAFWNKNAEKNDEMKEAKRFDDTVEFNEDGLMGSGLKEAGISSKLAAVSGNRANDMDALWKNDNRSQVIRAAQAQRESAKTEHEREQAKIKLQRQQELQRKEKEKHRNSKKERRTGR